MAVNTEFSLEYEIEETNEFSFPVIIVAGGSSSRMKGIDKITADIAGIPVLARTMLAFERSKFISEIIVVTKEEKINIVNEYASKFLISKLKSVAVGGNTRADSVNNGLKLIDSSNKFVLIHDGARPLVSESVIERVANADFSYSCVICANSCIDTVKKVKDNLVVETVNRSELVNVQTPQRLEVAKYRELTLKCENNNCITDDASVMEMFGEKVYVVEGDKRNIKITTEIDLKIAKVLLEDL